MTGPVQAGKRLRHDLLRRVHAGDVQYARKLTHSRTVIVLRAGGEELAFLYSSRSKRIVCFLPPGAPETAQWRVLLRGSQ